MVITHFSYNGLFMEMPVINAGRVGITPNLSGSQAFREPVISPMRIRIVQSNVYR